jgi:mannose-6-phosphate isomerase-like protein (cupin superfamily)
VPEPTLVLPGRGEVVGDSPDRRVEILSDDESLHATWSRFGPHRNGADLHVHRHHTDLFYVLEGELTVRLGAEDEPVVVPAGTLARVPPLVVHGFRNGSDAEVRYLNLHAPGQQFADYLRAMRDGREFSYDQHPPPPDGGRSPADAVLSRGGGVLADVPEIRIEELRLEPGAAREPHLHERHVASFSVLEGAVTFAAGTRELRAPAGSWVQVQPGLSVAVAAGGGEPARVLELRTPVSS